MLIVPKLDEHSEDPYYVQILEFIKKEIISGMIPSHTRLTSIRKLADQLNISATPVELAYQQLLSEGFIESKPKVGYFVTSIHTNPIAPQPILHQSDEPLPITSRDPREYEYDFHLSKNDFTKFPYRTWKRLFASNLMNSAALPYGNPQGEEGLRQVLTSYLHQYRGVNCSPEQIVIGADQYILASLLSLILHDASRSNRIAIEDPGYHLLPATFRKHGYEVIPVALEADGLSLEELYKSQANVVYTSPSHQFPRGMIMPISRRLQLIEWAKNNSAYIIEDDYDGEFRYHGKPIPSMQGLVDNSPVIYLSGFSQLLAPAFCIHYMVLPEQLMPKYHELRTELYLEHTAARWNQITLQQFIERGFLETHLRKMRQLYRRKHDLMIGAIHKYFENKAAITGTDAGFHVILTIDHALTEAELVAKARDAGIMIAPMSFTWWDKSQPKALEFMIGFGGIPEDRIDEGIRLLHKVWYS
ncbi:PLP-dependent aminotransferase family protein [Paenibacillus albiflavus]|uniref:PLP-dependent aminotransferase family protein n=1 Tax=Paenibacillus albiflavus TaxID=2545760 RepID=A0A4R4EHR0_9BACL|nr:PLP-dependent aminotransferase family protein [Paenibacillus albiflavus]TCZ78730.1 PLP-dependent aminotransferase family protein [Paenibacillus albiflavus]